MKKMLRDLTDQIYKYNQALEKRVLNEADIKEEEENLRDILNSKQDLEDFLEYLKHTQAKDFKEDNKNLMKLHTLLDNFSWYFQNIHKHLMNVFKNYPSNK